MQSPTGSGKTLGAVLGPAVALALALHFKVDSFQVGCKQANSVVVRVLTLHVQRWCSWECLLRRFASPALCRSLRAWYRYT